MICVFAAFVGHGPRLLCARHERDERGVVVVLLCVAVVLRLLSEVEFDR